MNRRWFLGVLATSSTPLVAGCPRGRGNASSDTTSETTSSTPSETIRLGTSAPVSPETDSRVPTPTPVSTPTPTQDTGDAYLFAEITEEEATEQANSLVYDYITERLSGQALLSSWGVLVEKTKLRADEIDTDLSADEFKRAIPLATVVEYKYQYNRQNELVAQPEVEFDTLLSHLPRTVTVTVPVGSGPAFSGEYEAVLPVAVHRYSIYNT
ncbi:MAG: hypothetical protein J07HQX50_00197 [Haloquadratum sp. J07HQX50]|jgi:hypothetical protein|nr:MAG: hypothetical protein J07HQX50_00197 [Haloquadratum sp. J07HQX50]